VFHLQRQTTEASLSAVKPLQFHCLYFPDSVTALRKAASLNGIAEIASPFGNCEKRMAPAGESHQVHTIAKTNLGLVAAPARHTPAPESIAAAAPFRA